MHGGHGIAGVDGTLKGVGAFHFGDVRNLANIELGCNARCHVLTARRCGEQNVAVAGGYGYDLSGHVLSQAVRQGVTVSVQNFADTSDLGGGGCSGTGIAASNQNMHITAALQGGSHGVESGTLDACVVVFGNNERSHFRVP